MAKSMVRNRNAVNRMFQLKSQLQAVSLRISVSWEPAGAGEALRKTFIGSFVSWCLGAGGRSSGAEAGGRGRS